MIVYIRANFSLAGNIAANPKDSKYTFEVTIEDKPPITVEILPAAKSIESYQQVDISDELLNVLRSNFTDLKKLPENLQAELKSFRLPISNATRRVLNLIKFCFGETSINEVLFGSKGSYWSEDRVNWKPLPSAIHITGDTRGIITLSARAKLLHRPSEMIVTSEETNAYVHDVESAIYHLMTLLYPNDTLVSRRYRMS